MDNTPFPTDASYRTPAENKERQEHEQRHREHEKCLASLNLHRSKQTLAIEELENKMSLVQGEVKRLRSTSTVTMMKKTLRRGVAYSAPFVLAVLLLAYLRYWNYSWIQASASCAPGSVAAGYGFSYNMYDIWERTAICEDRNGTRRKATW
jgi:hypothetical protein